MRKVIALAAITAGAFAAAAPAQATTGSVSTPPVTILGCTHQEHVVYDTERIPPVRVYGTVDCD